MGKKNMYQSCFVPPSVVLTFSRSRAKLKKTSNFAPLFLLLFSFVVILRILIIWISLIITRILLGMFRGSIVNLVKDCFFFILFDKKKYLHLVFFFSNNLFRVLS